MYVVVCDVDVNSLTCRIVGFRIPLPCQQPHFSPMPRYGFGYGMVCYVMLCTFVEMSSRYVLLHSIVAGGYSCSGNLQTAQLVPEIISN